MEKLGTGGMGVVWAALDPDLDRKVAIKLVRSVGLPQAERFLLREARLMARLSHPAVVPVFDVGRTGDQPFIVMELVDGEPLSELLRTARPWREVVALFEQAGRGLAAAHTAGITHRDFKPANVLVGRDGRVRVTDFGLACFDHVAIEDMTEGLLPATQDALPLTFSEVSDLESGLVQEIRLAGAIVGTPTYMAPEQHLGRPVGPAADQFSFCVSLYAALYAEHPFRREGDDGHRSISVLSAEVTAGRIREAPQGSDVPGWLRASLVRGLSVQPDDRWPTMAALLDTLAAGYRS